VRHGIPHFVDPSALTGLNRRFARLYDWFSWFYRLFSRVAFAYIGMSEEMARREVLDRLEPGGGRLLEVSVGPGVNLPYLVGRPDVGEVYGLDISLGQLRRCRSYLRRQGWTVPLYLGNAEELPFGDATFDAVFHIGGINFFNDKKKAIAEMIRVARPGTRIVICDENERGARAYERTLPGFRRSFQGGRQAVTAPVAAVPPEMQEVRVFDVWKGWMYCLEFRKPGMCRAHH
jgi:ubiquinone/menaquinone biosynthesis C-methylase UbiE